MGRQRAQERRCRSSLSRGHPSQTVGSRHRPSLHLASCLRFAPAVTASALDFSPSCGTPKRAMKPPGGESHDIFGAEFNGSPSHHRVLKPPGGGSSDIFGAPASAETPRLRKNLQPSSNLFGESNSSGEPPATPNSKAGNDSHSRLFGGPPSSASSVSPSARNRMKSSIVFDNDNNSNSDVTDGNPVTGEGYIDEKMNGSSMSSSSSTTSNGSNGSDNGNSPLNSMANGGAKARGRVPPGGFSSGFW